MTATWSPFGRIGACIVAAAVTVSSCASADPEPEPDPEDGSTAEATLDGLFLLSTLNIDGDDRFRGTPAVFEVEGEFATLEIDTGCGTHFGSFSVFADGTAGFTVAGGSTTQCDAIQAEQEQELLDLLAEVDQWSIEGDVVLLSTSSGDSLSMTR